MQKIAAEISLNYHLPPEWERQSGVMLTWPHRETIWAETIDAIDAVFVEVAMHVAEREKLIISCADITHQAHVKNLLKSAQINLDNIATYIAFSDDIWVRDHGPLAVLRANQPILLDFIFNGWGDKYPSDHDNQITPALSAQKAFGKTEVRSIDIVLEGGAIEVDGEGTLLTTQSCLLSKKRNPTLSQAELEHQLRELLGIKRILWLTHGHLAGDDTDGHIDTLARFVDAHTICYVRCDDPSDEHFATFQEMERELKTFSDYQGQLYKLIPLPWPKARYADYDGRRLPATYANFLMINDAILVPLYDDPADEIALRTLTACFPKRKIIGIPCLPVIQWYGSLHCMTMQLPVGVLP